MERQAGGGNKSLKLYENHYQDARYREQSDTAPTVAAQYGTGGNNVPLVRKETPASYALQGSMIGRADKNGPMGGGIGEDVSFTLNTVDRHAVYTVTADTYVQTGEEQSPALLARDFKSPAAVAYGIGRDAYNQGKNAQFAPTVTEETQPPLVAKGAGAVAQEYTVRRLTPLECARLQGFPDNWCDGLMDDNPSEDELAFWREVFEEYRRATGSPSKPKSDGQIAKWLSTPPSDAAQYKMWGNGIALPCARYVLRAIAGIDNAGMR